MVMPVLAAHTVACWCSATTALLWGKSPYSFAIKGKTAHEAMILIFVFLGLCPSFAVDHHTYTSHFLTQGGQLCCFSTHSVDHAIIWLSLYISWELALCYHGQGSQDCDITFYNGAKNPKIGFSISHVSLQWKVHTWTQVPALKISSPEATLKKTDTSMRLFGMALRQSYICAVLFWDWGVRFAAF